MKIKHITVANKVARYSEREGVIICDNSDYSIRFTFDDEWSAHEKKTARFVWNGAHVDVAITGDTCKVPAIRGAHEVQVGVYVDETELMTTTPAVIPCRDSIKSKSSTIQPEQVKEYRDEAAASAERAEAAADRAEGACPTHSWDGTVLTVTSSSGTSSADLQGPPGKPGDPGEKGEKGDAYTITDDDIAEIAERVEGATIVRAPKIVDTVDEMTDTGTVYVFKSTGTLWTHKLATVSEKTTHQITSGFENGRIGSSGSISTQAGYVTTPFIDLINDKDGNAYTSPFTLYLKGISFSYESVKSSYITHGQYKTDKTFIKREVTYLAAFTGNWKNAEFTDNGDGTCKIVFTPPVTDKAGTTPIGYARFTGEGTSADANVYIEYDKLVTKETWTDTGIAYPPAPAEKITDIAEFTLANPAVKGFTSAPNYSNTDYEYSYMDGNHATYKFAGSDYYRKDLPFPVVINWEKHENAVQYTVTLNTKSAILNTGMQTYYVKDNRLSIYNLIPGTTYYYKVYALCADATTKWLKDGSFKTTADRVRMLNIEGIQNARDIGGYMAGGSGTSSTVKYGLLFRGSAMDEGAYMRLSITGNGKEELTQRVGVRSDLDLRAGKTTSVIVDANDPNDPGAFYCAPFSNYVSAITDSNQRAYFKSILEYIVTRLEKNRPVYIHCQGGCDRTGTLMFLLLGLLGVTESDLAKEYELSSLSLMGSKTRTRNSTLYDYKGMVAAIKSYEGSNLTNKFEAFATECGVSSDTLTKFRSLMLE